MTKVIKYLCIFLIDEELENGDGDDIDFQPEDSAKLAQNKTIQNKSKSSSATVDQGNKNCLYIFQNVQYRTCSISIKCFSLFFGKNKTTR